MRIIALSATLPNLIDIGNWLNCRHEFIHYFDETFRPVPLTVRVESYGIDSNPYLFEKSLDAKVTEVIRRYSSGKQTLVFCNTKKGTEALALDLCKRLKLSPWRTNDLSANATAVAAIAQIQDEKLKAVMSGRVSYHHAGLPPDDRDTVEKLFVCGQRQVLCCTSTLANGVNLPAHLVIIKGTKCWRGAGAGYQRLSRSDVIQMLGRAGRKGFDESGIGVIMTSDSDKKYYDDVNVNADIVESKLDGFITEGSLSFICS